MPERNFPPPWSVEELDSCFVVKDANGQALAYMYFEKEPRRRFRRDELLTRDEPQRIRRQLRQTFSGLLRRQHGSGCADLITRTDRRTMILGGTDEPTIWPPVAYHDPHIDRPNSPPVSRAYCSMWCGICLRLPARKAGAS